MIRSNCTRPVTIAKRTQNTVFLVFMIITIHESKICDMSNFHGLLDIFIIEIYSS